MATAQAPAVTEVDRRIGAFCGAADFEVFRPIAYPTEVWTPDPFDVETIHAEARDLFARLLDRATAPADQRKAGRILLLLGEAGSGKTHLMRAFRTGAHRRGLAYFGYMQMTSSSGTYCRYMLHKLIDSLDKPYFQTAGNADQTSGLMRLAAAVAEQPTVSPGAVQRLRDEDLTPDECTELVVNLVDDALRSPGLKDQPADLLKALFFLQCGTSGNCPRAMSYLRGEQLSARDQQRLDIAESMSDDHQAQEMILRLGRLMWTLHGAALVLCLDQLEDIFEADHAEERFRRAMQGMTSIAAELPSALMVIACLEDYYDKLRNCLDESARDRLEKDPIPSKLAAARSGDEIVQLVGRHLEQLYDHCQAEHDGSDDVFPFAKEKLLGMAGNTARSVLAWCKEYRETCIGQGGLIEPVAMESALRGSATAIDPLARLDEAWNDFLVEQQQTPPEDDAKLAALLAESIEACSEEISTGHRFAADREGFRIRASRQGRRCDPIARWQLGVCNRSPGGGALGKQVVSVLDAAIAGEPPAIPVIVRTSEYRPTDPKTQIALAFRRLFEAGGRYVIVSDSDWRTMQALPAFRSAMKENNWLAEWLKRSRPLAGLMPLREILGLDDLEPCNADFEAAEAADAYSTVAAAGHAPAAATGECSAAASQAAGRTANDRSSAAYGPAPRDGVLRVGHTTDRAKSPVMLDASVLTKHAAFLGSTGSGKTTAALNLIEQLLLSGVPALLVDRKGDLVRYGCRSVWHKPLADDALAQRQRLLSEQLDVAIYTPGRMDGRPMALSVAPDNMAELTSADRQQTARQAASSLADMMGYRSNRRDKQCAAVLTKAIELLAEAGERITLDALIEYIREADTALINAIGLLDAKLFSRVGEDLQTLRIQKESLFPHTDDRLDAEVLLGLGTHARSGKTRLTVVSTKFLGDTASVQFWVAQLLLELGRWMSRNPASCLQAVVLFDEADVYLPAVGKPSTKEPMENLLKRARSAGLGVFLATQSPGDFDYRCRENINTWFVGKIKEDTAIKKMKPMLSEFKPDFTSRLSGQQTGDFFLATSGEVRSVRSGPCVVQTEQLCEDEILSLSRQRASDSAAPGSSCSLSDC